LRSCDSPCDSAHMSAGFSRMPHPNANQRIPIPELRKAEETSAHSFSGRSMGRCSIGSLDPIQERRPESVPLQSSSAHSRMRHAHETRPNHSHETRPSHHAHETRPSQRSFDSLDFSPERHSHPATSRPCSTVGSVPRSGPEGRRLSGSVASVAPTVSSHSRGSEIRRHSGSYASAAPTTPLEMLRRKAKSEKMERVMEARASVKRRLHVYTASNSFQKLSAAEQAAFWIGSSGGGQPNLSEEYANASKECVLLSGRDAESSEAAEFAAMSLEGEDRGEVPETAPADSKAGKPSVFDSLLSVGWGW